MEEFRRDARNVKLRISDNFIEDVTDVLKRFFRELEDPVFTLELHPQWKEAAGMFLTPSVCPKCGPIGMSALGPSDPRMVEQAAQTSFGCCILGGVQSHLGWGSR